MKGQRKSIGEVLWVAAPKILAGVAQLGLSLALLRTWGPERYGLIAVCLSAITLLDTVFGSAIDMSIFRLAPLLREQDPIQARQVEQAGLFLKPAASILLLPLIGLSSSWLSSLFFQRPDMGHLLLLSYLALLGILLVRSAQVHFQIEGTFRAYGLADLMHSALRFGGAALLLVSGMAAPDSVLWVLAGGSFVVAAVTLATSARPVILAPFRRQAVTDLLGLLRWYLATVVVGSLIGRMDVFFVSSLAGVQEAGVFAAAQLFALLPQLIGIYMAAVFSPKVLPMWRKGELGPVFFKFQAGLVGAGFAAYGLAVVTVGFLGRWVLPPAYQAAAPVILLLLPSGLCAFVAFPWTIPFLLYARPKLLLAVDCISLPVLVIAYMQVIPNFGIRGAAVVTSAFAFLRTAFYLILAGRILRTDPDGKAWMASPAFGNSMQLAGSST